MIGLDLGQSQDYTALSISERTILETDEMVTTDEDGMIAETFGAVPRRVPVVTPKLITRIDVRHLHRWELHTDYVVMAHEVLDIARKLPEKPVKPILVIDHTGVGRGVFDIFQHSGINIPILAVTITGGQQARFDPDRPWMWSVPKKDLAGAMQVAVQNDRLRIAPGLPLAAVLAREMQAFRVKITSAANMTYEAWREGDHDDLVLSVALGCWAIARLDGEGGIL